MTRYRPASFCCRGTVVVHVVSAGARGGASGYVLEPSLRLPEQRQALGVGRCLAASSWDVTTHDPISPPCQGCGLLWPSAAGIVGRVRPVRQRDSDDTGGRAGCLRERGPRSRKGILAIWYHVVKKR